MTINAITISNDNRPMCYVHLCNQPYSALWDTGSSVSLINIKVFQQIFPQAKLNPISHVLRSATGHDFKVFGETKINFEIKGLLQNTFTFVVAGPMTNTCILGFDFIKKFRIWINPETGHAIRNISPYLAPTKVTSNTPINSYAMHRITIPGRTERKVKLHADVPNGTYNINYDNELIPNVLGIALPGLVTVHDNVTHAIIANCTETPLTLPMHAPIAYLTMSHEISEITMTKTETNDAIDYSNIPPRYRENFKDLITKHRHLLNDDSTDIGKCSLVKQHIQLIDKDQLTCTPPHRIPPPLQPVVNTFVDQLLAAGVIQHSRSPFSSPLMLVKKATADKAKPIMEQYRVVNDFRKLNKNIVKDSYPMQNIYALIDDVSAAKIASVIDLRSAFFMQELAPDSRKYTAFSVPGKGHFEYTRSPQGLINSPSSFQRLLDKLLIEIPKVRVYIDDIVIFSDTWEEHLQTLKQVLDKLSAHNFKCSVKKFQLACGKINYLGYEITPGVSIRPGEAKTKAIRNWESPTDITQVKQFVGLCSFFRRVIPNFSEIAQPLTKLTRKDSGYTKGPLPANAQAAFDKLKSSLATRPTLSPPDFSKEFVLTTDASKIAIGAVLSQDKEEGEAPIAYFSRALSEREQKWAPFHLEHLAMVESAKHFAPYLRGRHFRLRTDHKPLLILNKTQGDALERLKIQLEDFDCTIEYMKGSDMIADGLSRQKNVSSIAFPNIHRNDIIKLQQADVLCKSIFLFLMNGTLPIDSFLRNVATKHAPDCVIKNNLLYFGDKIVAPVALHNWLFNLSHDDTLGGHLGPEKTHGKLAMQYWWPTMKTDLTHMCAQCVTCNKTNQRHSNAPPPLQKMPACDRPFQTVNLDLLTLPTASDGSKYLLVLVDSFSRYTEVAPIKDKKADTVTEAIFQTWICRHGTPENFHSDLGKEFTNELLKNLCNRLNVVQSFTTPGHPQGNGKVERTNKQLIQFLRKFLDSGRDWLQLLPYATFSINNTINKSTGHSPHYLLYYNHPVMPFQILDPKEKIYDESRVGDLITTMKTVYNDVLQHNSDSFKKQKVEYDKRCRDSRFQLHDIVYLNQTADLDKVGKKLKKPFNGPYTIVQMHGPVHVSIKRNRGHKLLKVHISRLKLQPYSRMACHAKHDNKTDYDDDDATWLAQPAQDQADAPHTQRDSSDAPAPNTVGPAPVPTLAPNPTNSDNPSAPAQMQAPPRSQQSPQVSLPPLTPPPPAQAADFGAQSQAPIPYPTQPPVQPPPMATPQPCAPKRQRRTYKAPLPYARPLTRQRARQANVQLTPALHPTWH